MTNATYALHLGLIRVVRGGVNCWERWVIATSGSIELPRQTPADLASAIAARQTADRDETQPSVRGVRATRSADNGQ